MSQSDLLKNIVVVLYQPQDLVNVGSVVRVMSNFGLTRLRLIEPAAFDPNRVEGIAHHTRPIIEAVESFKTLPEALEDCGFVLGTTARLRGTRRERLTPRQAAYSLLTASSGDSGATCALLFGREDDGLPNDAVDYCHALGTIPTHSFNSSLNLAQAVLVFCYELWLATNPKIEQENPLPERSTLPIIGVPPRWGETPGVMVALQAALEEDIQLATGTEREHLFVALADLLRTLHPNSTDYRMTYSMARLRAVLLRAAPRKDENRMLAHLFQNIARKLQARKE